MSSVQGAVAVVTGGAGGLGVAISEALAQAGLRVVVGYRHSAAPRRRWPDACPAKATSRCPPQ